MIGTEAGIQWAGARMLLNSYSARDALQHRAGATQSRGLGGPVRARG